MNYLRLYRDFYYITSSSLGVENYESIDVYGLSGYVASEGSVSVIESPEIINESKGRYYVNLSSGLYNIDDIYEMNWLVKYTTDSPEKRLITRFKLNPIVLGQNVDIRLNNQDVRLEIVNS